MARKVNVVLVDDLDGSELPEGEAETMQFAVDGTSYELDLTPANAQKVRDELGRYAAVARRVGRASGRGRVGAHGRGSSSGRASREETKAIREWAVAEGHMRAESRGRIPSAIRDMYEQSRHGSQTSIDTDVTPVTDVVDQQGETQEAPTRRKRSKDTAVESVPA